MEFCFSFKRVFGPNRVNRAAHCGKNALIEIGSLISYLKYRGVDFLAGVEVQLSHLFTLGKLHKISTFLVDILIYLLDNGFACHRLLLPLGF